MENVINTSFDAQSQKKKQLIEQHIEEGMAEIRKHALEASDTFYSDLIRKVPGWVNDSQCQTAVNSIFRLKSQSQAYTSELVGHVSSKIKTETNSWVRTHFIPLLKSEIITLSESVDAKAHTYLSELESLRVSLNIDQRHIIDKTTPSKTNRILSSGTSLLVGDIGGAIMGGAGGIDATLKTMGCEFGAGLILGIASLFTPIGLTAIVVSVVLSAIVGGKWALSSVESNIRRELTDEMIKVLKSTSKKEMFNRTILENVNKSLSEIRENLNAQWGVLIDTNGYKEAV